MNYEWMITCNCCGDMVAQGGQPALPNWTAQDEWSHSQHNGGCPTTFMDRARFQITSTEDPGGMWISYVIDWA